MQCLNCRRDIPENARVCQYCEAVVTAEATPEELDAAREVVAQFPPEALSELHRVFLENPTRDGFINAILVGPCPKCGSSQTAECAAPDDVSLTAHCYDCGQYFCAECGNLFTGEDDVCPCWLNEEDLEEE